MLFLKSKRQNLRTSTIFSRLPAFAAGFCVALLCYAFFVPPAVGTAPPPGGSDHRIEVQFKQTLHQQARADRWAHKLRAHDVMAHRKLRPLGSLQAEETRTAAWRVRADRHKRAAQVHAHKQRMHRKANRNFHLALRLASRKFGVSYGWLHACAHSEGHIHGYRYKNHVPQKHLGLDPFIMNIGGSGAGGWMQFMEGTFDSYPEARKSLPRQYRQWEDRLGQAYTAAYVFKTEGSGQWTGPGCAR